MTDKVDLFELTPLDAYAITKEVNAAGECTGVFFECLGTGETVGVIDREQAEAIIAILRSRFPAEGGAA